MVEEIYVGTDKTVIGVEKLSEVVPKQIKQQIAYRTESTKCSLSAIIMQYYYDEKDDEVQNARRRRYLRGQVSRNANTVVCRMLLLMRSL